MAKNLRIGLIETDDLMQQLASRWLQAKGYSVLCTSIQHLPADQPLLLIVADVSHPRDAGSVVRALRAAQAAPIVLVSARFHRMPVTSYELASQLDVAAVLAKPYTSEELHHAVAAALRQPGG